VGTTQKKPPALRKEGRRFKDYAKYGG